MTRTILCGEFTTGRRLTQVPVSATSWVTEHRGDGSIEITIPLNAPELRALVQKITTSGGLFPSLATFPTTTTWPSAPHTTTTWEHGDRLLPEFLASLEPERCFLAVADGDRILQFGRILPHAYDPKTNSLKITASGFGSIFGSRVVMGLPANWPGANPAAWAQTFTGMSLGTIMKRLIQLTMSHAGGALPIVLPADELAAADEAHTRTYKGSELAFVAARLDQLSGVINGPDLAWEPRFTADRKGIEVLMRTGTETDPLLHQAGADWTFDARAVRGNVSGIAVGRDPSRMTGKAWASGAGMDTATLIACAESPTWAASGLPLLESVEAHSDVSIPATLGRWADGTLAAGARPWMSWSATVRGMVLARPGDWARVWTPDDHAYLSMLLPAGYHRARVIRLSGGLDDKTDITWAPTLETR